MKRTVSAITLTLLLTVTLALAFDVQPVKASGTIYIKADGTIDPSSVNITTIDNVTYTFIGNVNDSIVVERNNIVIDGAGFTMQGQGEGPGIDLSNRSHVAVKNVRIAGFVTGIKLSSSSNNNITDNNLLNNAEGIFMWSSNSNVVTNNNVFANTIDGVNLSLSKNNTITENYVSTNSYYGIILYDSSSNNTLTRNNVINNEDGIRVASSSDNNLLIDNNASNNLDGVHVALSTKNTLTANNLYNNDCGIHLWSSHNNIFTNNNISNNSEGTLLEASRNNIVFHNNFANNDAQASATLGYVNVWDDGYPSGGNYWSNYTGVDFKSGISQNDTGSDGIDDAKHVINQNNTDRFPLMAPLYRFDAGIWNEATRYVEVVSNSSISNFRISSAGKIISFNVTGETGVGFCRIMIPNVIVQALWLNSYVVLVDGLSVEFRNWTDTTNTYIYVNYTHSGHEIAIALEFPSVIILTLFMTLTMLAVAFAKKRVFRGLRPKSKNVVEC